MKKGSYFAKHRQRLGMPAQQGERTAPTPIAPQKKELFENGQLVLLDKPLHWTSFDAVRKIRNAIQIKKVGHAGTLDPLATGLLIICTGKFTKKINEYMAAEKEYTGSITLGAVTPTYDLESQPEQAQPYAHLSEEQLVAAAQSFVGDIMQVPPIYSAIKKEGVALYELARRGKEITPEPRAVTISVFEITEIDLPVLHFKVVCSTGTYIRSLAHDYGQLLGCGAYLSALRRTRIGNCKVADAHTMDTFLQQLQQG